jgi:hypothetical protein
MTGAGNLGKWVKGSCVYCRIRKHNYISQFSFSSEDSKSGRNGRVKTSNTPNTPTTNPTTSTLAFIHGSPLGTPFTSSVAFGLRTSDNPQTTKTTPSWAKQATTTRAKKLNNCHIYEMLAAAQHLGRSHILPLASFHVETIIAANSCPARNNSCRRVRAKSVGTLFCHSMGGDDRKCLILFQKRGHAKRPSGCLRTIARRRYATISIAT